MLYFFVAGEKLRFRRQLHSFARMQHLINGVVCGEVLLEVVCGDDSIKVHMLRCRA
jgi:hypothetical protein